MVVHSERMAEDLDEFLLNSKIPVKVARRIFPYMARVRMNGNHNMSDEKIFDDVMIMTKTMDKELYESLRRVGGYDVIIHMAWLRFEKFYGTIWEFYAPSPSPPPPRD